ncbi:hypothetical protein AA313_de0210071 [Arthrobotrys entomopaga]|nr:hypothetical protein AA313_de0210071 [Arthrobotrys entomopaga]
MTIVAWKSQGRVHYVSRFLDTALICCTRKKFAGIKSTFGTNDSEVDSIVFASSKQTTTAKLTDKVFLTGRQTNGRVTGVSFFRSFFLSFFFLLSKGSRSHYGKIGEVPLYQVASINLFSYIYVIL